MVWSSFLPPVSEEYKGSRIAFYFLILIAIISTIRSLIHMFAPDGGANSIAGLAIANAEGANLIAIFAQWGSSQLILAILSWVVIFRYRFLIPFMLSMVLLEHILRIGVDQFKPLDVASTPPGGVGSLFLLPVAFVMLLLSLKKVPAENLPVP